jgi:hypothetical protein
MPHGLVSRGLPFVVLLAVIVAPACGQTLEPSRFFIGGPVALEVVQAFQAAARKLDSPDCQELLTDFEDVGGRALVENLDGRTPREYLADLIIRDGEIPKGSGRCAVPGSAAFTAGGAVVFVCGRNFRAERPGRRATALIHEMLHTLGLRENPPTSAEITAQVEKRCGR